MVYYTKENIWLSKEIFDELQLHTLQKGIIYTPLKGIFHEECILKYLKEYIEPVLSPPHYRIFKEEQLSELESRLNNFKEISFRGER